MGVLIQDMKIMTNQDINLARLISIKKKDKARLFRILKKHWHKDLLTNPYLSESRGDLIRDLIDWKHG